MIFVDPRAGSSDFLKPIRQRTNNQAELLTLDSGDVAFEGNGPDGDVAVGMEIKSISDFLTSARSGRLHDQLGRMSDAYQYVYLLIYGLFRPNDDGVIETYHRGGWEPLAPGKGRRAVYYYSEYDKHIASLELQRGVMVRRATSALEITWQVVNSYQWWQKPWDEHQSVESVKTQVGGIYHKATLCQLVAAQLPGVGWGKAKSLAKYFKSVDVMVGANPAELMEVEGIGNKLSVEIYQALRRK